MLAEMPKLYLCGDASSKNPTFVRQLRRGSDPRFLRGPARGLSPSIRRHHPARPGDLDQDGVARDTQHVGLRLQTIPLLKAQAASGCGCSHHLEFPAQLPRKSPNESQPG
jgi:hypothetical protein